MRWNPFEHEEPISLDREIKKQEAEEKADRQAKTQVLPPGEVRSELLYDNRPDKANLSSTPVQSRSEQGFFFEFARRLLQGEKLPEHLLNPTQAELYKALVNKDKELVGLSEADLPSGFSQADYAGLMARLRLYMQLVHDPKFLEGTKLTPMEKFVITESLVHNKTFVDISKSPEISVASNQKARFVMERHSGAMHKLLGLLK